MLLVARRGVIVLHEAYGWRDLEKKALAKDPAERYRSCADFASALHTAGSPDPDLLIRTSGEMRVSNFLLWQIAYSEMYVTPVLWPDFDERDLCEAVLEYQRRERRFGRVTR